MTQSSSEGVRLGAKMHFEMPETGIFKAPEGWLILNVNLDQKTIVCAPIQTYVPEKDVWMTLSSWVNSDH